MCSDKNNKRLLKKRLILPLIFIGAILLGLIFNNMIGWGSLLLAWAILPIDR